MNIFSITPIKSSKGKHNSGHVKNTSLITNLFIKNNFISMLPYRPSYSDKLFLMDYEKFCYTIFDSTKCAQSKQQKKYL